MFFTIGNRLARDGGTDRRIRAFEFCSGIEKAVFRGVTYIGNEAFFKCNALIEVYNLGPLELAAGSPDNGYAAYYALVVHRSLDEEPVGEVTTDDGFVFKTYGNLCRLTAYVGNEENIVLGALNITAAKLRPIPWARERLIVGESSASPSPKR